MFSGAPTAKPDFSKNVTEVITVYSVIGHHSKVIRTCIYSISMYLNLLYVLISYYTV